jgi:transposase
VPAGQRQRRPPRQDQHLRQGPARAAAGGLAAWRAVWAALPNNPVLAARFRYLTTREHNRLARQQAGAACAAALLRWLHVVVTRRVEWNPAIAAGKTLQPAA